MKLSSHSVGSAWVGITLLNPYSAFARHHGRSSLSHRHLAVRSNLAPTPITEVVESAVSPCFGPDCVAAYSVSNSQPSNLPCARANNTVILAGVESQKWTLLCDVDFFAQNIYPLLYAGSFETCLDYCDRHNHENRSDRCAGFVYAPDRINFDNDCYLKSSTNNSISPSTLHLIGATLVPESIGSTASMTSVEQPTRTMAGSEIGADVSGRIYMPSVARAQLLGSSTNSPTNQYVSHTPALPIKLAGALLQPGINVGLTTDYALASDTGSWTQHNLPLHFELSNLTSIPRLSRDGGKGGNINGSHIFYFCDTSTFGDVQGPLGYMNGFVSSSAAIDVFSKAVRDEALELQDPIGQWQDDVGRLRGWIPMTAGEEAFNIAVSGSGYRYAVWPESSFIPLNQSHSLLYAPIVYVQVDMATQRAQFTATGNTLITVSMDPTYGPHADRVVNQLFTENELQWGSLGGIRAWGPDGPDHNDGAVYLFSQVAGGVLAAKVAPGQIADRTAYVYWDGAAWSGRMPDKDSTAYLINQPVTDFDIVYSPTYRTFIMFYLTPSADNTFYMRALQSRDDIVPPYEQGGSEDYVENLFRHEWSEPMVLYQARAPAEGYIYAGGCHFGYFGADDFAHGGQQLLITWTEHTNKDPNDPASGYAHMAVSVHLV